MKRIFADTWYWVALLDEEGDSHERAEAAKQALGNVRLVTTQEVLVEFLNYFAARHGRYWREAAAELVREVLDSGDVEVVAQSKASFAKGFALFEDRPDKGYSMTDCVSMRTMDASGIDQVLTADRHFEQEGYRALLR